MSAGSYKLVQNLGKEYIELKLTDSCVNAIENYVKMEELSHELEINFSKGTLSVPTEDASNPQVYNFKLIKNINKVVECYKQDKEILEENIMQHMGGVKTSMRISGKDDSYVATKRKMNLAIENEQKSVTKVVKTVMNTKKRKAKAISMFEKTLPKPNRPAYFKKESLLQLKKNISEKNTKFDQVSSASTQPANKSAEKISECLIHFLALAPSSFSKLFLKVSSLFGQPNRCTFKQELLKIANVDLSGPETTYKLKECNYSKVNMNWSSYTENEKLIVEESLEKMEKNKKSENKNLKRKLQTFPLGPSKEKKKPCLMKKLIKATKSKNISKINIPTMNSSNGSANKISNEKTNGNPIKKMESTTVQLSSSISSEFKKIENVMEMKKPSTSKLGHVCQNNLNPKSKNSSNAENECAQPENITKSKVFLEAKSTQNGDYKSKFTCITTEKQRYEYKSVFDQEYKLYLQLHEKISKASHKFEEYQKKVSGLRLPELSQLKKTIYAEYTKLKKDKDYNDCREKYNNLHLKLDYIKGLIHEYDKNRRERRLN